MYRLFQHLPRCIALIKVYNGHNDQKQLDVLFDKVKWYVISIKI